MMTLERTKLESLKRSARCALQTVLLWVSQHLLGNTRRNSTVGCPQSQLLEKRQLLAAAIGHFDQVTADNYFIGWSFDPDLPAHSNRIQVRIDNQVVADLPTDQLRQDVNNVFRIQGNHGFRIPIPDRFKTGRTHTVEVFGVDLNDGRVSKLGSTKTFRVANNLPIGHADGVSENGLIWGWSLDPDTARDFLLVEIRVDGNRIARVYANQDRPDVNAALGVPGRHGFSYQLPSRITESGRAHTIDAYAVDAQTGELRRLSGSGRTFVGKNNAPIGRVDVVTSDLTVKAWSLDPDNPTQPVNIDVIIDGDFVETIAPNVVRPDVNAAYRLPQDAVVGVEYSIPARFNDGVLHSIEFVSQDLTTNDSTTLPGSGLTFRSQNTAPEGKVDQLTNQFAVVGWGADFQSSVTIEVTIDRHFKYRLKPDEARPDINALGYEGNNGFRFQIPDRFLDENYHWIDVAVIHDATGQSYPLASHFAGFESDWIIAEHGGDVPLVVRHSGNPNIGFYDYSPSVMEVDGRTHVWWCGGGPSVAGDNTMHMSAAGDPFRGQGVFSTPESVMHNSGEHTGNHDGGHICDPTVVRTDGIFKKLYTSAPILDTTATFDGGPHFISKIGVATSTDGVNWTRAFGGKPIIQPRNVTGRIGEYGAGQPSLVYKPEDGYYYLAYSDTTGDGGEAAGFYDQILIRSRDFLFQKGVQELRSDGWEPLPDHWLSKPPANSGLSGSRSPSQFDRPHGAIPHAQGLELAYVPDQNVWLAINASHQDPSPADLFTVRVYSDRSISSGHAVQPIDTHHLMAQWTEQPGVKTNQFGHLSTVNGVIPLDTVTSISTSGVYSDHGAWDLAYSGFNVPVNYNIRSNSSSLFSNRIDSLFEEDEELFGLLYS